MMSYWTCSGARALVVCAGLAASSPGFASEPASLKPDISATREPAPALHSAAIAADCTEADRAQQDDAAAPSVRRSLLLEMIAASPRCYDKNSSPAQIAQAMEMYNLLPPGMFTGGLRYFTAGTVWTGNSQQAGSGRAARANLRYSFPADGTIWGTTSGSNSLNAIMNARFTAANADNGFELIRQALASWRKDCGLLYSEVPDNGQAYNTSIFASGVGDVRIGAIPQDGLSGVLAYDQFPQSGADMALDANDFVNGQNFWNAANNYRFLRNVVSHEHGHGLGYIHPVPCSGTKLMEPFINTNFDGIQVDELRGGQVNYGDRFSGNNSVAAAKDFGNLTSPIVKSIIEQSLSTNGMSGFNSSNLDWYKFTIDSAQNVVITVSPTGGLYTEGPQSSGCNGTTAAVNAQIAGNLNVELRDAAGNVILQNANTQPAGVDEVITANALAAGTYSVRVIDVGPNALADQALQLYNLTIRVGAAKAPPLAIAGVNKRILAGNRCYFFGNINSRVNEPGATLNNASFDWDLNGDSIFETNDNPTPNFTYTSNGVVNVTLRVTDSNGMSSTDTITVTVGGAVSSLASVTPSGGQLGANVPVTLSGISLGGVTSASQVTVSGTGVTVTGTPVISGGGTTITGLSFNIAINAPTGVRSVTITNADGGGQSATLSTGFSVVNTPPANDTCAAPISWGSVTGPRPFSNVGSLTGTPQSFPGTGCPTAGPINNDVWYSWTAPSNGNLNIATDSLTAGTPSPFNTRVAVYNSTSCPPTNLLGCDDFGTAYGVFVQGGRTYLFQVGSTTANLVGNANVILTFTPILGSCCDSSGNCSLQPSNACIGGSVWQGAGTTCETNPCDPPFGTCCAASGDCTETDQIGCVSGSFAPGGTCSPNPCTQPTGSCCSTDGTCVTDNQAGCDGGRVFTSGQSCNPNPCSQPTGACCAPAGGCTVTTQVACANSFQGGGTVCVPNTCPQPQGACCTGAACTTSTAAACSGSFQGSTVACGTAGNPTTCCPANFNHSGGVTVQDIFDYLAAYFAGLPSADFNSAGGLSVQDIFDFLGAYFTGCPG